MLEGRLVGGKLIEYRGKSKKWKRRVGLRWVEGKWDGLGLDGADDYMTVARELTNALNPAHSV